MPIIFRIEDKMGIGPFHSPSSSRIIWHDDYPSFPTPIVEGLEFDAYCHVCGCKDLDQLLMWFEPILDQLSKLGFFICEVEVDEGSVLFGEYQVVFMKGMGKYKCRIPLKEVC